MFRRLGVMAGGVLLLVAMALPLAARPTTTTVTVQAPCTETQFDAALASLPDNSAARLTFNCGVSPTSIHLSTTKLIGEFVQSSPQTLEIDGGGKITLSGSGAPLLFVVQGLVGGLTLRNLTVREAGNGVVQVNNGAVLSIENSELLLNSNTSGAGYGGVIYNLSGRSITIHNSRLHNNLANYGGAVYHGNGNLTIVDSEIYSNTSYYDGGGLWIAGTAALNNARVSGNIANNAGANGGGVFGVGDLTVNGGKFFGNAAPAYGGAIDWDGPLSISGTVLYTNTANQGGALWLAGQTHADMPVYMTSTQFLTDAAVSDGGALFAKASVNLHVTDGLFQANRADEFGGAVDIGNNVDLTLHRTSFISNTVTGEGGAIMSRSASTLLSYDSSFTANQANNGGAVAAYRTAQFSNNQLTYNQAGHYGGAVYSVGALSFDDVTFIGNQAAQKGGAIYAEPGTATHNYVRTSTFRQNSALNGGAIYAANTLVLDVRTSAFVSNTASASGGAIYRDYNSFSTSLRDSQFSWNMAAGYGGGVALLNGSGLSAEHVTFNANSAGQLGGGLFTTGNADLRNNLTFSGNSAAYGGGLFASTGDVHLLNATFVSNTASTSGGAIYVPTVGGAASVFVTATIFSNVTGGNCGGGALAVINGSLDTDGTCGGAATTPQALKLQPLAYNLGPWLGADASIPMLTHRPGPGSSAIDQLYGAYWVNFAAEDQRGFARPYGLAADVGALEISDHEIDPQVYLPLIRR